MSNDDLYMAMYRERLLAGANLPGRTGALNLLCLDRDEHPRNIETAAHYLGLRQEWKASGKADPEKFAETHGLYTGPDAIPREDQPVGGLHHDFVHVGKEGFRVLYLAAPTKRPRGRPRSTLTPDQRVAERERLIASWEAKGWSKQLLARLKRHQLFMVAAHVGIADPGHRGDNETLRGAIARKLKLR